MPTEATWVTPDSVSVQAILTNAAVTTADKLLVDSTLKRSDKTLSMTVARIRGAIQIAGRSPLSLVAGTIPPEAEQHAAVLAVQTLVGAIPQLSQFVMTLPGGGKSGLVKMIDTAEAWIKAVEEGKPVVPPSAPTGADYLTAVSASNPALEAIKWSDAYGTSDDYSAGQVENPDGTFSELKPLDMNQKP